MEGGFVLGKLFLFLVIAAIWVVYIALRRWASSGNPLRRFIDRHGAGNVGAWVAIGLVLLVGTYLTLVYS